MVYCNRSQNKILHVSRYLIQINCQFRRHTVFNEKLITLFKTFFRQLIDYMKWCVWGVGSLLLKYFLPPDHLLYVLCVRLIFYVN